RRRHTRLQGDWSSDVCSSDLSYTVVRRGLMRAPSHADQHRWVEGVNMSMTEQPSYSYRPLRAGLTRRAEPDDQTAHNFSAESPEIGRASCRERGEAHVGGGSR